MGLRRGVRASSSPEPAARLRLPGLRLAGSGAARGAASSARTARRRWPTRPRASGSAPSSPAVVAAAPARPERLLAGAAGALVEPLWRPAGREHYEPIAWDAAFARIARGAARARHRRTRRSSTPPGVPATRPPSCISSSRASSAPTTCRTARTCVTSRAAWASATRSAWAREPSASGLRAGRRDLRDRPEPGQQPPAHADRAPGGQAPRLPHRQREPAARARAGALRAPAGAARAARGVRRRSRICTCRCAWAATSRCCAAS